MAKVPPNDDHCRQWLTNNGYESTEPVSKCPCRTTGEVEDLRHCLTCHEVIDCWDGDEPVEPRDVYCASGCWPQENLRRVTTTMASAVTSCGAR